MLLEIIVALLYFTNKIFLLLEKKAGWIFGIAASSLATVYFFYLEFYIFLSLEFACLVIMILGFIGNNRTKVLAYLIYGIISLVMIYLLFNIEESGFMEFVTSILFIVSFLLLANGRWYSGWLFLGVSHILMLFVSLTKNQEFFALMQGLSVVICIISLSKRYFKERGVILFKRPQI